MRILLCIIFFGINLCTTAQIISGKLENAAVKTVFFTYSYDNLYYQTDTVSLNEEGIFQKKFDNKSLMIVYLRTNGRNYEFSISPKSNIYATGNLASDSLLWNTMRIKGIGKELCVQHFLYKEMVKKNMKWDFRKDETAFIQQVNEWKRYRDSLRKAVVYDLSHKIISKETATFLRRDSINDVYWTIAALATYRPLAINQHENDSFYKKHIKPHVIFTEDSDYLSSKKYMEMFNRIGSAKYEEALKSKDSTQIKKEGFEVNLVKFYDKHTSKKLREQLLADAIRFNLTYVYDEIPETKFAYYDSILKVYGSQISNPKVLRSAQNEISKKKETRIKTRKGQPAPEFSLMDSTGKIYTLKDFAGKIIYIDAWASWCAPCIGEIPEYKKLVEKYKNENDIIFISVSIDDSRKIWIEKGLLKHNPPGLQLWADLGGWGSKFAKDYRISGVPQYFIIGKEGEIINFNAPRPSDRDALRKELEALF